MTNLVIVADLHTTDEAVGGTVTCDREPAIRGYIEAGPNRSPRGLFEFDVGGSGSQICCSRGSAAQRGKAGDQRRGMDAPHIAPDAQSKAGGGRLVSSPERRRTSPPKLAGRSPSTGPVRDEACRAQRRILQVPMQSI
jgi:hypothetical protein